MSQDLPTILQKITRRLKGYSKRLIAWGLKRIPHPRIFDDGYSIEDNTLVTLYTDHEDLFPGYEPRINPAKMTKTKRVPVVLIAVAKNEALTAPDWYKQITNQSRLPDEILVVDTGSTDDTVTILKTLSSSSPVPFKVICSPGLNISQGRNLAIQSSKLEHIAVTDLGTKAHPDWLEKLIFPFEHAPETEVSGGWYDTVNDQGNPYRWRKWISLLGKNPQEILSPSVSIAFTRTAWERAGGYPEWLTLTGEDTYFDLELKRTCRSWAFCPDALVDWEAPKTIWQYWKKMYRWSIGDGETGMRASAYWYAFIVSSQTILGILIGLMMLLIGIIITSPLLLAGSFFVFLLIILRAYLTSKKAHYSAQEVIIVIGILAAEALGFIRGAYRRKDVIKRHIQSARGLYFILAGIPIDDTGGGARSTQISLELIRKQCIVCYLNIYPKSESIDLSISIKHPNLITIPADSFSVNAFCDQYDIDLSKFTTRAIIELPHPKWIPIIDALKSKGAIIAYDLIDEWDSKLGEGWYSQDIEKAIIDKSDVLTATAPVLKTKLEKFSYRDVHLLPNAVNLRLFDHRKKHPLPTDLPESDFVITYVGALYGDWFDWDLLINIASTYYQANVIVIGDYREQCPKRLPNLKFLGLKPQTSLPAYLAYTDVAIIPWKISEVTKATSPLKVYEYLAMHVPVVAPDLPPLRYIPAVYLAESSDAFLMQIGKARTRIINPEKIDRFIHQNSWESRVVNIMQMMD
ncbi:MAG: glycosyltransferase [Anaerolineaceae bacterium]|nr:glycosyltransferase [Anaerolineaceae bacterium]